MNLKNKTYMKGPEFKKRQLWLPFEDAAGIVLQLMEETKENAAKWFKEWKKSFCSKNIKKVKAEFQMTLPFIEFTNTAT